MSEPFDLTEDLEAILGDDLRMAFVYGESELERLYLRDDIRDSYTDEELEGLRREVIVMALGKERIPDVTHVGELRHIIYDTEDALSVQVPLSKYEGVFVSFGGEDATAVLFDVVDRTREWIDDEYDPQ